jgi:hypothetical protein
VIDVSTPLGNIKSLGPYSKNPEIEIDLKVVRLLTWDESLKRVAHDWIVLLVQATM